MKKRTRVCEYCEQPLTGKPHECRVTLTYKDGTQETVKLTGATRVTGGSKGLQRYEDWITAKVAAGTGGNRAMWAREMLSELTSTWQSMNVRQRQTMRNAINEDALGAWSEWGKKF